MMNRREVLAGLGASAVMAGSAARAQSALSSIMASSGLGGVTSAALLDLGTGQILESHNPDLPRPPASVTKALTAQYALLGLGSGYRFSTRLMTTGAVSGGVLQGDLFLVGSGDPQLDADQLADLARQLAARGVRQVNGRFLTVATALPQLTEIDSEQPDHVAYNPGLGGLNLNYNTVYLQWRSGALSLTARAERNAPQVHGISISRANRGGPTFTYSGSTGGEQWSVASGAVSGAGSRNLPVHYPARYAGEVFRILAAGAGVSVPPAQAATQAGGTVLAEVSSDPLSEIVRDCMRYSNNLTAEVIGLAASRNVGLPFGDLRQSGNSMTRWMAGQLGTRNANFVDHSGLSDQSQISARDMVVYLAASEWGDILHGSMKEMQVGNSNSFHAKTGTLNFVDALAGFMQGRSGRRMAFAIFAGDPATRARIPMSQRDNAPGASAWGARSRQQERLLLERWSAY
ncbi:D-alanyl-D-alanine carboxypeptidase/D-alanyl-D-alanine-endopeptidase [Paracoccaceae bacterium GXU_MW_L88]